MPTKAASKPAAKPRARKPARTHETVLIKPVRKPGGKTVRLYDDSKPLTLKGDTSKPGGATAKALFEACGHTVVDTAAVHDKPVKRSVQADIDICQGRLDSQAERIAKLREHIDGIIAVCSDMTQNYTALSKSNQELRDWMEVIDESVAGQLGKCKDQLKENERNVAAMIAEERKYNVSRYALLHDQIEGMPSAIENMEQSQSAMRDDIGKLQTRVDSINNPLTDAIQQLAELQFEHDEFKRRLYDNTDRLIMMGGNTCGEWHNSRCVRIWRRIAQFFS